MHDIVKAGKARYLGASSMYAWQFSKALHFAREHGWTRFVSMQDHYNLLYREEEREMMPLCADAGIGVLPWSPVPRAQVALAWVAQHAVVTAPIVGASKPHHLDDAVAALTLNLSASEMKQLENPYVPRTVAGHS